MKKTKKIFLTICCAFLASMMFANTKPELKKSETVQIQTYLEKLEFSKVLKVEAALEINFMINKMNEIIVVSTNHAELDEFIKAGLNYKKLEVSDLLYNKEYMLPVHIVVKN
jgi:hypothetical protein